MSNETKVVVTHQFGRVKALLRAMDQKSLQRVVARSIRRTMPSVQKAMFAEIQSKKMLKLKYSELKTRARIYIEGGSQTSISSQYGKVWIPPRPESLGRFFPKRVRKGRSKVVMKQDKFGGWNGVQLYSVRVNTYGAPYLKNPDRSFLVKKGGGNVIFARMAGAKRLPIEKVWGPSMAELVAQSGILPSVAAKAQARYTTEFTANMEWFTDQAIKKALRAKLSKA